jgi:outer membrane protein
MKNVLLIWNVVLTLALGYLLFQQWGGKKNASTAAGISKTQHDSLSSFRIAYFDYDSLDNNYEAIKDVKKELERMENTNATEYQRLDQKLASRYQQLQEKAQKEGMSQQQQEAAGLELENLKRENDKIKADLSEKYNERAINMRRELQTAIEDFLKQYNSGKKYSYILSYEPGLFYFRDTTFNITADVVAGLNQAYRQKAPAPKKKEK